MIDSHNNQADSLNSEAAPQQVGLSKVSQILWPIKQAFVTVCKDGRCVGEPGTAGEGITLAAGGELKFQ